MIENPEQEELKETLAPVTSTREPYLRLTLVSLAGPLCWVLHFATVYLLEGLLCHSDNFFRQLIPAVIVGASLVFGGACCWLMIASRYWISKAGGGRIQSESFLVSVNRMLAGLSMLAIFWAATGVFFLGVCAAGY